MSNDSKVLVKDEDVLSTRMVLTLLSSFITKMKNKMTEEETTLSTTNMIAIAGAIEVLTDLHNLILEQVKKKREEEFFNDIDADDDGDGHFDA